MAEHHILDFDASAASAYADLRNRQGLHLVDRLDDILTELYKADYPDPDYRPISPEEYRERQLGGKTPDAWGKWVYYPWRETLVHIPDEETFIRLRTLRNLYKITPDESVRLRRSRIGVIGLSVGHSVAMAIAMERIAGEIRIADFDTLELGNMNRIRTGLHNLGIPKTTIVAREIAEIDPYIKVICFSDGIDKYNIEAFFEEGGKLDVLVEECDSVEVKILARQVAKKKRIPVVMDTSDRLMIDIERFDLDPDYPIMHGMVDENLDYDFLKSLKTSKDKLPYILPFAGIDQISDRMAASALELGTSITSWPQLATEVQIGGALAARTCRDILFNLGKTASGRYYHDNLSKLKSNSFVPFEDYTYSRKEDWGLSCSKSSIKYRRNVELELILKEALSSPSAANLQNWKFSIKENKILIGFEKIYNFAVFDANYLYSLIGLGIISSSISIIATKYGMRTEVKISNSDRPTVEVAFYSDNVIVDWRYSFLDIRYTNRLSQQNDKVDQNFLVDLELELKHDDICHVTDDASINKLEEIIGEFDSIRMLNNSTHHELFEIELSTNKKNSRLRQNGLFVEDLMLSKAHEIGVKIAQRARVIDCLRTGNLAGAFKKINRTEPEFKDAYVILTGKLETMEDIFGMGFRILDYWLHCTKRKLSLHPITSPIPILNSLKRSSSSPLVDQVDRIEYLEKELLKLCSVHHNEVVFIAKVKKGIEQYSRNREKLFVKIQYT